MYILYIFMHHKKTDDKQGGMPVTRRSEKLAVIKRDLGEDICGVCLLVCLSEPHV